MVQYEVIEFYYGEWGGSCGKFDTLEKAVQRKELCEEQKEEMNEKFEIVVRLYGEKNQMIEELLSPATLVTEELTYTTDEDGNFQIVQNNSFIVMTPKQCLDLKEVLSVHLDMLNRSKVCQMDKSCCVLMTIIRRR